MRLKKVNDFIEENEILRNAYFLVIALLLAFGTLQFAGTALSTEKPVVSVVSCSMYPQYNVGDILFVQGQQFENINEGDVIVYDVRNEAQVAIGGERFNFTATKENPQPSQNTPIGEVKLLQVNSDMSETATSALFEINGETHRVTEGQSFSIQGESVVFNSLSGMEIPVVHRVTVKEDTHVETKGDNNLHQLDFEKNVTADQIHGKVFFRVPLLGNVKILTMDYLGLTGGQPFLIDTTPSCNNRT